jgi:hypothetical protein
MLNSASKFLKIITVINFSKPEQIIKKNQVDRGLIPHPSFGGNPGNTSCDTLYTSDIFERNESESIKSFPLSVQSVGILPILITLCLNSMTFLRS